MDVHHGVLLQAIERSLALIVVVDRQLYGTGLIGHLIRFEDCRQFLWKYNGKITRVSYGLQRGHKIPETITSYERKDPIFFNIVTQI